MIVLLDGKGLEPSLPHMAAGLIMLMVPSHMRGQQPVQKLAQLPIPPWPEGQVKMIGHQAIGEDAHGHTIGRVAQQREKGGVVFRLPEDLGPCIPPIDDVRAEPPDEARAVRGMARLYAIWEAGSTAKKNVPFFLSPKNYSRSFAGCDLNTRSIAQESETCPITRLIP